MIYRNLIIPAVSGSLLVLCFAGCVSPMPSPVEQVYTLVTARQLSDVAMSAGPNPTFIGTELKIGETLTWLDGKTYAQWSEQELVTAPPGREDPMLADVYSGLSANSEIKLQILYAENETVIGKVYWVDSRLGLVLAENGSPVHVLEAPLSIVEGKRLERTLADLKFDPGAVDGVIDSDTRRALGFYMEYRGLDYRFQTPVISEAVYREITGVSLSIF